VKRNQSSLTAAGNAIVRAIESEKPAGERVCCDPYARRFVDARLSYFVKFFAALGYADWKGFLGGSFLPCESITLTPIWRPA
jgi:O-methyltransferase involved in polyketide biosynthesis